MTKTILVYDLRVRLVLNTFFCFCEPSTMRTRSKPLLNENRWSATWLRSLYLRSEVDFNSVPSQNYMCKIISTFALTLGEGKSRMLTSGNLTQVLR